MKQILRILLLIIILPLAAIFLMPLFIALLEPTGLHEYVFIGELLGVIATIPVGIFVMRARVDDTSNGLLKLAVIGALVGGSVGFIGSIAWVESIYPSGDMNFFVGPIVGGPFGVVLGALGGFFYWMFLSIAQGKK